MAMNISSFISGLFPSRDSRIVNSYRKHVERINALEADIKKLSDAELKAKTAEFKARIEKGETLDQLLEEAFAVVREASVRTLNQRHYDVQLIGGIIMFNSGIAEMKTGEGKTLVATLPVYLEALSGKGVHVVTVNDYLSRRDAVWMGQIFSFLGMSIGVINHDTSYIYDPAHIDEDAKRDEIASFKVMYDFLKPCSRRDSYYADITYGTNNEFGFDFLRDNLEYNPNDLRQREFNCAIVDEIDSILIDESRTPLIISLPAGQSEDLYVRFAGIARELEKEADYTVDEKRHTISMTDAGIEKVEKILSLDNLYASGGIKMVHHLESAVKAKALFLKDKQYVVKDNQIIIVDEYTGRLQPGRRWSEGLHQAIEAKEGVAINRESRTAASITFQNYFRMYRKLAGMTGTAKTSAEEFLKVYGLEVVEVPTNRAIQRKDFNDLIYQSEKGKFTSLVKTIKELNQKGQPVLVGTASIEKNELFSLYLQREGIPHQMLNAKPEFAEKEGEIIANAGKKGAVTIATNMAGRGVDIKLGGPTATKEEADQVRELGGLYVIGTERHEARRIDNQLRGRSGRQGDPGTTQFFVSLEDDLMRVFATDTVKSLMGKFKIPEDQAIENFMVTRGLESAQTRIEGFHFDSRRHILDYDNVLNEQRRSVYARRRSVLLGNKETLEQEYVALSSAMTEEELEKVKGHEQKIGTDRFLGVLRTVLLQSIDLFWVDHLEMMDYLRSSVNLRSYGQRDPLVEYKKEGLRLFKDMQISIDGEAVRILSSLVVEEAAKTGDNANPDTSDKHLVNSISSAEQIVPSKGLIESRGEDESPLTKQSDSKHAKNPVKNTNEYDRNDKVIVVKGEEKKEVKYKKAEELLKDGWTIQGRA